MEQQSLQFRCQCTPRNREPTVRGPELRERVGHRLTCDHQDRSREEDEGEQDRGSRLYESSTYWTEREAARRPALQLVDVARGRRVAVEAPRPTPWCDHGSAAQATV